MQVVDDDVFGPEATRDPYAYFEYLRENHPVYWNALHGLWIVTRYDDVSWLTLQDKIFSSAVYKNDLRPAYPKIEDSEQYLYKYVAGFQAGTLNQQDRPAHFEMRKRIQHYFSPQRLKNWHGFIVQTVNRLLDEAERRGVMDIVGELAEPLPPLLVQKILNVPDCDTPFLHATGKIMMSISNGEKGRMQTLAKGWGDLEAYVMPLMQQRQVDPQDDYITCLAGGERDGVFSRQDVVANVTLLLTGSHDTTINLISNAVLAFLQHPQQWALLKKDPELHVKSATEECLRYDPPVKSLQRILAQDVELRGKTLKKGDRLRWIISSANRDPEKFAGPDIFDITRSPNLHIGFGYGAHRCPAAGVSRMITHEILKALATRFPGLRLHPSAKLEYKSSITSRSLMALPVVWN